MEILGLCFWFVFPVCIFDLFVETFLSLNRSVCCFLVKSKVLLDDSPYHDYQPSSCILFFPDLIEFYLGKG